MYNFKQNFTDEEIHLVLKSLGSDLLIRLNKSGNIEVVIPSTREREHFVLYLTPNKRYLWRRHNKLGDCYPLNMRNRKQLSELIHEYTSLGKTFKQVYKYYDFSKHAEFDTVKDALAYFIPYLKKYRNIEV